MREIKEVTLIARVPKRVAREIRRIAEEEDRSVAHVMRRAMEREIAWRDEHHSPTHERERP